MKRSLAAVAAMVLVGPSPAHASDNGPKEWEADVAFAYTVLGGKHKTGGLTPTIAARRVWAINETWRASAGLGLGFFGIGDEPKWVGFLGGPTGSVSVRPWKPDVRLTLGIQLDFGRLPTCNEWSPSVCLPSTGFAPAASFGVDVYTDGPAAVTSFVQVRDVNTAPWHGAGIAGGIGGRFSF